MESPNVSPRISEILDNPEKVDSLSLSNRKISLALENLSKVASEIQRRFEQWDDKVENNLTPVPIQDLDFWKVIIEGAVKQLREELVNGK